MSNRIKWAGLIAAVVVLFSLSACASVPFLSVQQPPAVTLPTPQPEVSSEPTQPAPVPSTDTAGLAAYQGALEEIYTTVSPSIVNIRVTVPVEQSETLFQFFWGQSQSEEPQVQEGLGSGFVWDAEGHIVTNYHVVADADSINVTFADGTTVPAEVVGQDPDSDLAVVKVDVSAEHLHPVQMADSTTVKVGQMAIAIGNPFGLSGTMTVGIVSALERSLPVQSTNGQSLSYSIPDIIQTDAPINPGNSGGVLVDDTGQIIGVTSAIISPVQASAGIGFAIPSVIVQKIVPVLITDGQYEHPRLGISGVSLTSDLAEAMHLNAEQRGVLVVEVQSDGPADQAGLKGSDKTVTIGDNDEVKVGGDVIIGIDDQPVDTFDDLTIYLARSTEVGQTVNLTILRNGDEKQVEVALDARPEITEETTVQHGDAAYLGIRGSTLTPSMAAAMDLKKDQEGVLISEVAQDSPADKAGLHGSYKTAAIDGQLVPIGGDVITALDGHPVDSVETLSSLLREYQPDDTIQLTILRDGQQKDIDVTLTALP